MPSSPDSLIWKTVFDKNFTRKPFFVTPGFPILYSLIIGRQGQGDKC